MAQQSGRRHSCPKVGEGAVSVQQVASRRMTGLDWGETPSGMSCACSKTASQKGGAAEFTQVACHFSRVLACCLWAQSYTSHRAWPTSGRPCTPYTESIAAIGVAVTTTSGDSDDANSPGTGAHYVALRCCFSCDRADRGCAWFWRYRRQRGGNRQDSFCCLFGLGRGLVHLWLPPTLEPVPRLKPIDTLHCFSLFHTLITQEIL